jgi:hypothetical protein
MKIPETILSCPFCGSLEVEICRTNPDACWVACANEYCEAETKSHRTRSGAIRYWNTRAIRCETATVIQDDDKRK